MAKAKKKNTKGKKVIAKSTKKRKTSKSAGKTVEMGGGMDINLSFHQP